MDDDDDEQHDGYNNNNYDDENDVENTFQPPRHALQSAIVITGLVSDAEYLTDKLRSHMNKYWFRYDSSSCSTNAAAVTKMTRDVLLDCMGYNRNDETLSGSVSGGIGSAAASSSSSGGNDDDEDGAEEQQQQQQQRAGRPLGICAFLLGIGSKHLYRPSCITVIEANGVSEEYVAYAMGMGSEIANSELAKKWRRHMGQNEAVDMMKGILQGVAKERGWLEDSTTRTEEEVNEEEKNKEDDDKRDADLMVVCEIVSSRGINTQYIKL
jgi:20S proteasome alpha/beta subunit